MAHAYLSRMPVLYSDPSFLGHERIGKFAGAILLQQEVEGVPDDRLKMLKWPHLKAELDKRESDWPKGSSYEFDHEKQSVTWQFGSESGAPEFLVWHLTNVELASPKPSDVASRIVRQVNKVAMGED